MSLRDLNLKKSYDSDVDDILNDFYIPALSVSVGYDRLAGFFCSTSLAVAAKGIAGLIFNGGRFRLICGAKLTGEDIKAVTQSEKDLSQIIAENALSEFDDIAGLEDKFVENHVRALGWMVSRGLIDIKIAVALGVQNQFLDYQEVLIAGIFHQKIGILRDREGNEISFSGSDNETAKAWTQNIEEFKVFCSWEDSQSEYFYADKTRFQSFWAGSGKRTLVLDVPEAVKKKLIEISPVDINELDLAKLYTASRRKKFKLWGHQISALDKWVRNQYKCIFEMATGTGKTFAALACLKHLLSSEDKLITVVTSPFSHLIHQWQDSTETVGIRAQKTLNVFSGNPTWRNTLVDSIRDLNNGVINSLIILTTHDTFYKKEFIQFLLNSSCKKFLIADEVHGIGSEMRKDGLIKEYDYRLGLSATPSRWMDSEGTDLIYDYFGIKDKNDLFIFSLEDAITTINPETGQTYLTPYDYHPFFTELTEKELDEYIEVSQKISKAYYYARNEADRNQYFELLCFERQRIIQNARKKYEVFEEIINTMGEVSHCLVYCSPEQIDKVQEIMNQYQIIQHKFTQQESTAPSKKLEGISEREYILNCFADGTYQALVAIKCLDEGVDIPQVRTAIVMASTGNPRQYIQRRGRLLRRYPGKVKATIYDVIVFPSISKRNILPKPLAELEKKMVRSELRRYEEFSKISLNLVENLRKIREIENKLGWG